MAGNSGRWGWHQLDRRWVSRLVEATDVRAGDLVLDIGAGTGVITAELVRAGAHVIAVELHHERAAFLRRRFGEDPVTVVRADATDLRLPRHAFKVVANPPFAVTTALLRRLTVPSSRLERASIVLPSWAVLRWTAGRGVGSAASRHLFRYERGPTIPRRAFRPAPPKPAIVLHVVRTAPRW